ncbi:MAG: Tfp pilus assembly PilM family ATPase, partial [Lysobacterales bacterium]
MNILLEKYFDFIKKLLPQSSAAAISAIGLDLGSNTCKLVELSQKGDRYLLINLSEIP